MLVLRAAASGEEADSTQLFLLYVRVVAFDFKKINKMRTKYEKHVC